MQNAMPYSLILKKNVFFPHTLNLYVLNYSKHKQHEMVRLCKGDAVCSPRGRKYTLLYVFFWVIPRRLNFICRRFGTLSVPSS
jgi:hypothetical protein